MTTATALTLIAILAVAAVATARRLLGGWLNPVTVYAAVWISLSVMLATPLGGIEPLLPKTWTAIVVAFAAFAAGAAYAGIIASAGRRLAPADRVEQEEPYDVPRLLRWFKIGTLALVGWSALELVTLLPVIRSAGGVHALFSNGIAVRRALYAAGVSAAGSDFNGGSLFRSVVGYGLFMGTVTLFWAPVVARFGRWRLALAPLLVMGVFSFVTLQRFAFVYSVLMFVFAAAYHRLPAPVRLRRAGASFRKPAVVLALLLPVMVYAPLKLRQPDLTPAKAVESVTAYFTGGAGALNEQIRQFGFQPRDGKAGHGGWILWGEGTIAARLGAHVDLPPKDLPYVDVGARSPVLSNVYTYLAYAMNDFGPLGLVVCPFLFGLVASAVGYLALVRRRRAWIPAAAILMTSVAMSFFGLSLVRDTRYVAVACAAPLLERLIRPRGARAPLALGSGNAC